jgi:hypothetical protein
MAWGYVQTLGGFTWDEYERLGEELGRVVPAGAILHVAGPYEAGIRIIDVWESEEAFNRFRDDHLTPALVRLFGERRAAERAGGIEPLDVRNLMTA